MPAARSSTHDRSARGPDLGIPRARLRRRLRAGLIGILALTAIAVAAATAQAQAPIVVYDENFENGVGATPVLLTGYTGATGQTYTADPAWLTDCNGAVVQFNSPDADQAASGCAAAVDYGRVRQLAYALGVHGGGAAATNHAVAAYTEGDPGPNNVEFETVDDIALPTNGRFLTFQVDAAAVNCGVSAPLYQFSLTSGATSTPVGGVINACTSTSTVNVPASGAAPAIVATVGTYTSNGAVLFTGSAVGIEMRNANGSGAGNDAAFDNIQILDVTPSLAKTFAPASIAAGGVSTLTFTIDNTDELAAKAGWSFVDTLPAGMTVADTPDASTTCLNGTVDATAGGGEISVEGDLAAGQASCTVSVDVTSSVVGTHVNEDVTCNGCNPPPPAELEVYEPQPWGCAAFGYLFQTPNPNDPAPTNTIQEVDLVSGDAPQIANTPHPTNAVAYNVVDDFIYGMQWVRNPDDSVTSTLVRVHADGNVEELGMPAGMPDDETYHVGDVDANGHYWVANPAVGGGLDWWQVDLNGPTPIVLDQGTAVDAATAGSPADWAFIDGAFYGIAGAVPAGGDARLVSFTPGAATLVDEGPLPVVGTAADFGAVFADAAGFLYGSRNSDGFIFRINPATNGTILVTNEGPSSANNDGARCADAPIPTITVTKTVDGRVSPEDQFTVGLSDDTENELTSVTTTGTETTASTTNWPVSQDTTYTISDAMEAGSPTPLGEYVKSIECTDADGNTVETGGSEPNWTLTVADATDYTCNITNQAVADLGITKSAPATVDPGGQLTWTMTVTNAGPSSSSGSTVTDSLPAGITNAASSTPGCSVAGGTVTCAVGALAVGASTQITVTGTAPATGSTCITNSASITGDQNDPNAANNTATASTCTTPPPPGRSNITLDKTASDTTVTVGDTVTYTLVARNEGPGAATEATIADTVPSRLDVRSATTTQGTCSVTGNQVSCPVGPMTVGQTVTVTVRAVAIGAGDTTNAATVSSPNCAATPCATGSVGVKIKKPKLDLRKTASRSRIAAGETVTYTLRVRNPSERAVRNVKTCDRLPSGLVYVSASPKAKLAKGQYCWTAKRLGAGKSKTYKLTVRALAGTSGKTVNNASATSPDARTDRAKRPVQVRGAGVAAGGVTG